jgi:outer membrane usher protein
VAAGHDAGTGKHKPPQQTLRADRPLAILQPSLKIRVLASADQT